MTALFQTLVPLYGAIAIGWLAGRFGIMHANAAQVLSRFVFLFAMPIAVFGFFAGATPPGGDVLPMMAGYGLAAIIMMVTTGLVARARLKLTLAETGAHTFLSTCGNAIFLGLPIALSIPGWRQPFLMLMLIEGTLIYGTAVALFQWSAAQNNASAPDEPGDTKSHGFAPVAARGVFLTLRTPIVAAALLGLAATLARLPVPGPMLDLAGFFGQAAAPSGLFVLGLYIAALPKHDTRQFADTIIMAGIAKLIAFPVLTFVLVGLFTGWDMTLVAPATFMTSLPPAVSSVVQASHFGIYERRTAAALITLTPISLITIILVLLWLAPSQG